MGQPGERRSGRRFWMGLTLFLAWGSLGACASELQGVDTLEPRDRARFLRCRSHVEQRLCDGVDDCPDRVLELYHAEPPQRRGVWLRDYGCPAALVETDGDAGPDFRPR